MPDFSRVLQVAVSVALLSAVPVAHAVSAPRAQSKLEIKDLKGRTVSLSKLPQRILIDDGRYLVALSLIHPNPPSLLAGWPRDINRIGDRTYQRFVKKFPELEKVPQVASSAGTFSLERALAVKPDVALFTLGLGPSAEEVAPARIGRRPGHLHRLLLAALREPRAEPANSRPPHRAGDAGRGVHHLPPHSPGAHFRRAQGGEEPAAAEGVPRGPCRHVRRLLQLAGQGQRRRLHRFVGGHNIGADVLPGSFGKLNLEYVVAQNPPIYIATGGPHLEKVGGLVVGPGLHRGAGACRADQGGGAPRHRHAVGRDRRPGVRSLSSIAQFAARPARGRVVGQVDSSRALREARSRTDPRGPEPQLPVGAARRHLLDQFAITAC